MKVHTASGFDWTDGSMTGLRMELIEVGANGCLTRLLRDILKCVAIGVDIPVVLKGYEEEEEDAIYWTRSRATEKTRMASHLTCLSGPPTPPPFPRKGLGKAFFFLGTRGPQGQNSILFRIR